MTGVNGPLSAEKRAYEQAEAAARLRGAAEALGVLHGRPPARQKAPARYAMALLARTVGPVDWSAAGLPVAPPPQNPPPKSLRNIVPLTHPTATRLALASMQLYCEGMRLADRPARFARLAAFFAQALPESDPELIRWRERVCFERVDAADCSPEVIGNLVAALNWRRENDGEDAYLTGIVRGKLLAAYRLRGSESDLAEAVRLAEQEAVVRTARYGPGHPITVVAHSILCRCLLMQAEAAADQAEQRNLASRALADITKVRAARDRMYGVTAPNSTTSRRSEAHALLLLGELDRARAYLENILTFQQIRNGNKCA